MFDFSSKHESLRQARLRRCSVCRNDGHTKRHCPNRQPLSLDIPVVPVIHQERNDSPSAHIVNLREPVPSRSVLNDITVFAEQPVASPKVVTVDFRHLIYRHTRTVSQSSSLPKGLPPVSTPSVALRPLKETRVPLSQRMARGYAALYACCEQLFSKVYRSVTANVLRPTMIIAMVLLFVSFPLSKYISNVKADTEQIAAVSTQAFLSLGDSTFAAFQADMGKAESSLSDALKAFSDASALVSENHRLLQSVVSFLPVIGTEVKGKYQLLEAGHHISLGNTYLLKGMKESQVADISVSVSDRLEVIIRHLRAAKPQYEQALVSLAAVDPDILPVAYVQQFSDLQLLFTAFVGDIDEVVSLADTMNTIVGADGLKRYIVVTQNSAEQRATGGFWGAAAVCDFQQGKFLGCNVLGGGLYDLQGQYSEYLVPPMPVQIVNKRWECHDMNWWPDFSLSAKLLANCFQKSKGITVDGVIAVNASVLEKILAITGPIVNEEYDITLSSYNALDTLQQKVEVDYDKEKNTPKAILGDVLSDLLNYDYSRVDMMRLLASLHEAAAERDIQAFFFDPQNQQKIEEFGWSGSLVKQGESQDYLMVVNSNLLGEKSDARINQHIEHQALVHDDGTVDVTVVVSREHTGSPSEQFYGKTNLNYIRFYVPQGATLLDAGGFQYPPEEYFQVPESWYTKDPFVAVIEKTADVHNESGTQIMQESGKTVFGNWMITNPGSSSQVYVIYRLPFRIEISTHIRDNGHWVKQLVAAQATSASSYQLYMQKQSGSQGYIHSRVIYPDTWRPIWRSDDDIVLAQNGATLDVSFNEDIVFGVVMEHVQSE